MAKQKRVYVVGDRLTGNIHSQAHASHRQAAKAAKAFDRAEGSRNRYAVGSAKVDRETAHNLTHGNARILKASIVSDTKASSAGKGGGHHPSQSSSGHGGGVHRDKRGRFT